jgi:hypothetical protein
MTTRRAPSSIMLPLALALALALVLVVLVLRLAWARAAVPEEPHEAASRLAGWVPDVGRTLQPRKLRKGRSSRALRTPVQGWHARYAIAP